MTASPASPAAPDDDRATDQEVPAAADPDPDEQMREKFRSAMAHKHGASAAGKGGHGDAGNYGHSVGTGPSKRMFRRKAGG